MWMPIIGNLTLMYQNTKKRSLHLCALNITGEEAGQIKITQKENIQAGYRNGSRIVNC